MTTQEIVTELRNIASYSTSKKEVCTQAADLIEELTKDYISGYSIPESVYIDTEKLNEKIEEIKQMTIKEFWESFGESIRIGIHCDTQEKADKLCMAFDRLGKTWQSGAKYEENMTRWGIYKEKTIYFNDGIYGSTNDYPKSWSNIIEFEDIEDFKMYKSFTKADLHSWDIVVFRDGKAGIVRLDMDCIIMKNGADKLDDIRNDLIFDTDHNGDIMQVYRPTEPYQCTYDEDKYYLDGKLMFDRNPKKKMTLADIEKELGYGIEVVSEKER